MIGPLRFLTRLSKRFCTDQRGATALEFALVGPIHIALMFSILEAGLVTTRTALLDGAMNEVARLIYTGQASSGAVTEDDISQLVCNKLGAFAANCRENLTVEIQPVSGYGARPETDVQCRDSENEDIDPVVSYTPGGGAQIIFMRVCLTTDVIVPGLGLAMQMNKTEGNRYRIISSTAFMNEPF